MDQAQAFIDDIRDHPGDDGRRLIFADWLEDHDQPDRAEFIRSQIERFNLEEFDPRKKQLADREGELLKRHQRKWLGTLPSAVREWTCRRGLLDEATIRVDVLLKRGVRLLRKHPVRHLSLVFEPGDMDRIGDVANCAVLASVEALDLSGNSSLTAEGLGVLAGSPHLGRLRELDLSRTQIRAEGLRALAGSPLAARLVSLDLTDNRLEASGAEALVSAPGFVNLRSLRLTRTQLGSTGIEVLATSRRLPELTSLLLDYNSVPDAGARALAASARLAGLRELNLASAQMTADGAAALAKSPHIRRLERLELLGTPVGVDGVAAMAKSGFLDSMTVLALSGNRLGAAGIKALRKAKPRHLRHLLLGTCEVDDEAMGELARWPSLATLFELNLYCNKVTGFGIRKLIDSPHLGPLRQINLEQNRLGDLGAEVLAVWPGLAGMRWLKLGGNGIGDAGACALANSPHLGTFDALDLSSNGIDEEGKKAFHQPGVRERIARLAPWDTGSISYYSPLSAERPRD